jgi:hypothetical protein
MNELEKKHEIIKIYNFLCETNKVRVDWNNSLFNISEAAANCAQVLTTAKRIIDYRNEEEKQKKKRIPSKLLMEKISEDFDNLYSQMEVNPDMDILYFPGWAESGEGSNPYYLKKWILKMLLEHNKHTESTAEPDTLNDSILDNLRNNLEVGINYSLALRGAFYSLWNDGEGIDIPVNITFLLFDILGVLVDKTRELRFAIEKEEEIGDRNSRNSSIRTPARIEDYKKHEKYPDLELMIKSYQGTPKELREINKLMADILDTENRVTIRRYRHLFFEDLQR